MNPKLYLDELGISQDLSGLRTLDIGAFDGPFTFELERRGAHVTALDIQDPDITVFNAVKAIKHSSANYVRGSIYDAQPTTLESMTSCSVKSGCCWINRLGQPSRLCPLLGHCEQ